MEVNFSIFVSSSDNYSDLWPLFFDLFKKYWPEYDSVIYLQTQEKEYSHHGLDIVCTKVGHLDGFGRTLRAGLDKVSNENILFIMIDYIFMGKVKHEYIKSCYDYFCSQELDSLCLIYQNYPHTIAMSNSDYLYVVPPAPYIMFSYQIAFWKKSMLREMALPHENPWMSEWYGSLRAEKMQIRLACVRAGKEPIKYDGAGCLHQGKWLNNAIEFLNSIHYEFDFDKRGYYAEDHSFLSRMKLKWMIYSTGLKGSWLDLWRRKNIFFLL